MFEKVNPAHPDKIADRIAGALVDLAYKYVSDPKIAVEVLIGHGECHIIAETSEHLEKEEVEGIVKRIAGSSVAVSYKEVPQDKHLAENQENGLRCGDNGIFRGEHVTHEQVRLASLAKELYDKYMADGKYILDEEKRLLIICQSNAKAEEISEEITKYGSYFWGFKCLVNPLGDWTGGTDVDSGATNRKLGSDMGDAVTGGGLHGKDLSKADVSVNIYAHIKAQETGKPVELSCAIGDDTVDGKPFAEIVEIARQYIRDYGGFEKFAEWGLI